MNEIIIFNNFRALEEVIAEIQENWKHTQWKGILPVIQNQNNETWLTPDDELKIITGV